MLKLLIKGLSQDAIQVKYLCVGCGLMQLLCVGYGLMQLLCVGCGLMQLLTMCGVWSNAVARGVAT